MAIRRPKTEEATINLTPMIDVVFLLVIFFMVGSKFSEAESRIKVSVPTVGELRSITRAPDERVVEVSTDGDVSLDGVPMSLADLTVTLSQQHANYPGLKVAVRGDGASSLQTFAEVLNAVRSSGVREMAIAAKPIDGRIRR
jgi:biopolymer transport protein ExbD